MTDQFCDKFLTTLSGCFAAKMSICEQQALVKTCTRFSHEFMIWRDHDGQTKFISGSCLRLTGHPAHTFIENRHLLERLIHPYDLELWRQKHENPQHETIHIRLIKDSGDIVWFEHNCFPVYDNDGAVLNHVGNFVDITEAKKTQQQLVKQHQQLQTLFSQVETGKREWEWSLDCINDVVILASQNGRVKRINKAVKQLFNINIADIIGRNWCSLLPMELATEKNLPKEGVFYLATLKKWISYETFPFTEDLHTEVGQVITLHDTTELWHAHRKLTKAYDQQKATQSQLIQQEKMASIGQLAAGVAHEINNPTGFITSNLASLGKYTAKLNEHIAFVEQLVEQTGNQEAINAIQQHQKKLKLSFIQDDLGDLIAESLEGAGRIKSIVQNLKNFSRVDSEGFCANNLHQCLDTSLSIGWNEIKYNATVSKDYQPIPDIYCSAQQLNQVFLNLLVNAAQAMEEQGEIHIQTTTMEPWVVIHISDTGSGIAPECLSRIFDPFFTTKEVGKGTGLGLSICYDIIKKHHGEISVDSEVGQGTTFTIKLPISTPESEEHTEN